MLLIIRNERPINPERTIDLELLLIDPFLLLLPLFCCRSLLPFRCYSSVLLLILILMLLLLLRMLPLLLLLLLSIWNYDSPLPLLPLIRLIDRLIVDNADQFFAVASPSNTKRIGVSPLL